MRVRYRWRLFRPAPPDAEGHAPGPRPTGPCGRLRRPDSPSVARRIIEPMAAMENAPLVDSRAVQRHWPCRGQAGPTSPANDQPGTARAPMRAQPPDRSSCAATAAARLPAPAPAGSREKATSSMPSQHTAMLQCRRAGWIRTGCEPEHRGLQMAPGSGPGHAVGQHGHEDEHREVAGPPVQPRHATQRFDESSARGARRRRRVPSATCAGTSRWPSSRKRATVRSAPRADSAETAPRHHDQPLGRDTDPAGLPDDSGRDRRSPAIIIIQTVPWRLPARLFRLPRAWPAAPAARCHWRATPRPTIRLKASTAARNARHQGGLPIQAVAMRPQQPAEPPAPPCRR